jgi:amino acid adenylation domain-containing protein
MISTVASPRSLSPFQQGRLFDALCARDAGLRQLSCVLAGPLDVDAFRAAWERAVERHALLRSRYVWGEVAEPTLSELPHAEPHFDMLDWRGLAAPQQQERLEEFLSAGRARGLDLTTPPLMRLALARTDKDEHIFVWTFHQLLLDNASAARLLGEVADDYYALCRGQEAPPRPAPAEADFGAAFRRPRPVGVESFWRQALRGFVAPTPLPLDAAPDTPRRAAPPRRRQRLGLSPELTVGLRSLARQHSVGLGAAVRAAWALLLGIYCGEEEVLFGVAASLRKQEFSGLGALDYLAPLRVETAAHGSLANFLRELDGQMEQAQAHAHTPLYALRMWSDVPRGRPLFESIVVFEERPLTLAAAEHLSRRAGFAVRGARVEEGWDYPLCLTAEAAETLTLDLLYDGSRFDTDAAARLLDYVRNLLAGMATCHDGNLSRLSPLGAESRHRIINGWNQTRVPYDPREFVHHAFEAQVARQPAALALAMERRFLSYEKLNEQANRLAHYLRAQGVGPGVRVGILLERSPEMVVSLLAVLKAGGAYVPLDPQYPAERLAYMLEDSRAVVLLTQEELAGRLPACAARTVCLEACREEIERESRENPRDRLDPSDLAYVIYTSGSTGRPKGVAVEHRALTAYIQCMRGMFTAEDFSGLLASTSICFDPSVLELFSTLTSGGKLMLVENAMQLLTMSQAGHVTFINTVPSIMTVMLEHGPLPPSVRTICLCGEPLKRSLVEQCFRNSSARQVINFYGPTEATVNSTCGLMQRGAKDMPPIGRPLDNEQCYILDRHLNPLPAGAPGELYIGGACLARGYLGRPALTAERFIPDPFSREPGARLYRTGDLTRHLDDGQIAFLGRTDHQVKIRGLRIELGEVEAALELHPSVREAVVRPAGEGLSAYVIPQTAEGFVAAELREFVRARLPHYMVPAHFVALAEWPLTPNGKIDRKALPDPAPPRPAPGQAQATTPTEVEREVARVWREVLRVESAGPDDDFFKLGGDPLLLLRTQAELRRRFGRKVSLAELSAVVTLGEQARLFADAPVSRAGFDESQERARKQREALAQQRQKMRKER